MTPTWLESRWERWWLDSTRIMFFTEWLDSSHNQWLESESFLHNIWASDGQTQFVCTERDSITAFVVFKIGAKFLFPCHCEDETDGCQWHALGVSVFPRGRCLSGNLCLNLGLVGLVSTVKLYCKIWLNGRKQNAEWCERMPDRAKYFTFLQQLSERVSYQVQFRKILYDEK